MNPNAELKIVVLKIAVAKQIIACKLAISESSETFPAKKEELEIVNEWCKRSAGDFFGLPSVLMYEHAKELCVMVVMGMDTRECTKAEIVTSIFKERQCGSLTDVACLILDEAILEIMPKDMYKQTLVEVPEMSSALERARENITEEHLAEVREKVYKSLHKPWRK